MPEDDTIYKIGRYLRPRLVGMRANAVRMGYRDTDMLNGQRIEAVEAKGKHLFIEFANDWVLHSHLGLYGTWHHYDLGERWKKPERQASIVIETDDQIYVCFHAKEADISKSHGTGRRELLHRLGPDLLAPHFDMLAAVDRARDLLDPETPLTDVLLDQRPACGIGNVYKSELLFLEYQPPSRSLGELEDKELAKLYTLARALLQKNLGGGPRRTRFEEDGRGILWVYGRRGQPCLHCGTTIQYTRMGKDLRSTYWCETCQADHRETPDTPDAP